VSGLINLARNIGGSVGTSFLTTMLARRQQFHQDRLTARLEQQNPYFASRTTSLSSYFTHAGGITSSSQQAQHLAMASIYNQMLVQASMLSYLDVIAVLAAAAAAVIPLVFLMKKRPPGGEAAVH
jgi:DHA2 family multidrug resistance protein